MGDWVRLGLSATLLATGPAGVKDTVYMTVEESQRLSFPSATEFVPIAQGAWQVAQLGRPAAGRYIIDRVIGKHLYIDYAVTLDGAGRVTRVDILQYREAYGGQVQDRDWLNQFTGKGSGSALQVGSDIRNISGATLSCVHITEGVKRIVQLYGRGT